MAKVVDLTEDIKKLATTNLPDARVYKNLEKMDTFINKQSEKTWWHQAINYTEQESHAEVLCAHSFRSQSPTIRPGPRVVQVAERPLE